VVVVVRSNLSDWGPSALFSVWPLVLLFYPLFGAILMVKVKIRSLIDQAFITRAESRLLVANEVAIVRFVNQREINAFVDFGTIILAGSSEPEEKQVPIIGKCL